MTDELEPCPFCGSDRVLDMWPDSTGRDVYCAECEATVYFPSYSKPDAVSHYNRRASSARIAALEAELAEAKKEIDRLMTLIREVKI